MVLSTSNPSSFDDYEPVRNPLTNPSLAPKFDLAPPNKTDLQNIYEDLRHFVQKRDAKGLPKSVKLYAFITVSEGVGFQTGIFATAKISTQKIGYGVVTGLYPVHWILLLHGDFDENLLDVSEWAQLGYRDKKSKRFQIPCHWTAGKYPLDFRSPQKIKEVSFVSHMSKVGFNPTLDISEAQRVEEAIKFARRYGRWTSEGYLMTEFPFGVYFEAYGLRDFIEDVSFDEARQIVKDFLSQQNS